MKFPKRFNNMLGVSSLLLILAGYMHPAVASEKPGTGMIPLSAEEKAYIEKNWQKIEKPLPNKIGAARIQIERAKQGLPEMSVSAGDFYSRESVSASGKKSSAAASTSSLTASATATLPSAVNNSTLPSFPPIGNQGLLGSCVAWATTYYQATHELGLLNGFNNQTSNVTTLSPKWTYDLMDDGFDNGLNCAAPYALLAASGASTIATFPYDSNYTAWDMKPNDWINALNMRMGSLQYVSGLNEGSTQDLTAVKTLLANGHVLTFGTYIDGWVMTEVKSNPNSANDHVGKQAVSWVSSATGSHMATIVGYDDNVWIDINGNGQVDPGETGAFLVANSWGTTWGNSGFVWIAYDAFQSVSSVPGGPSTNRLSAACISGDYAFSSVPKAQNYTPSLVSIFEIGEDVRDSIAVSVGTSWTTEITPIQTFSTPALYFAGGQLEFSGSTPSSQSFKPLPGTFAIDLTDLIQSDGPGLQRFYLGVEALSGYSYTLSAYALMDFVNQATATYTGQLPVTQTGVSWSYIDYTPTPPVAAPLAAVITSPVNGEVIEGSFPIVVQETSAVEVKFYVDSSLKTKDTTIPYIYFYNSTLLTNGPHVVTIIALDANGDQVTNSVNVTVKN